MACQLNSKNAQKGAALIFALLGLVMLTLLGLAFAFHSNIEYRMSENYVTHQEALSIADAGLNFAKSQLQGTDFTAVLATQSDVPAYVNSDQPADGTDAARNAISTRAARNVNFNAPPQPAKTYKANGILTPVTGQPYGNGRYFVKVSNNSGGGGGSVFGSDPDPNVDTDFRIL
ncbi:MAG TPA: PilX N-terminal domain-containing pilus assembly protein, partial [Acidobacteriota bacterium]